jgi:hypothetical protein
MTNLTIYVGLGLLGCLDIVVCVSAAVKHDAKREKAELECIIPAKSACVVRPK